VALVTLDPSDATPIYAQLERALRAAIATGRLRVGDQLPTVRQLAVDLRVNANTVARVYAELERRGVLETQRGVGSFVAADRAAAHPLEEKGRRLRHLVTRMLADADQAGFDIDDLLRELSEQRRQQADRSRSAKERSS
jgi:GntR family transcriptional regulator